MLSASEEKKLIQQASAGDQSALEQLLLCHYDVLYQHVDPKIGFQYRATIGADDILQDTFVQAFRDIQKFEDRPGASFVGWLKAIAENRLMDAIKGMQRKKRGGDFKRVDGADAYKSSMAEFVAILEDEADSPSRLVAKDEAIDAMEAAIAVLPDDQREAVSLRCLQGLSLEETAKRMKKTPAAVRSLIHRAKQSLHQAMYRTSIWLTKR